MFKIFENKIKTKKARILVIGLGYVGGPLVNLIYSKKFQVSGLDFNKQRIKKLQEKYKKINFYDNYNDINFALIDIIIIALPTPIDKKNNPDLKSIINCVSKLIKKISNSKLIILESTSYPSTTKRLIANPFSKKFTIGNNFFVGYSPEREDPGNKSFSIDNITKITSGCTINCKKLTSLFYKKICKKVSLASSMETAEMTKIFENIFRAVNIGLVNETKQISKKLQIDMDEVVSLAKTKPFGFMPFYPGPGVGGHCIPVDPFYLSWIAKKKNFSTKFIYLAGKINSDMPKLISKEIYLNFKSYKKKPKILIIGMSYKKDIDDYRNSPAIQIFKNLLKYKFNLNYHDNFIPKININNKKYSSIKISKKMLKTYDAILLTTDHSYLNKNLIYTNSKKIFDTRNFFSNYPKKKIIKL